VAQAAATVEQLSMLAAHLIRAQTAPPWHVELTKMVSLLSGLLNSCRLEANQLHVSVCASWLSLSLSVEEMAQSHSELSPFHDLGVVTGAASAGATLAAAANSHARLLLRSHVDGRQRHAATPSVNGITDELGLLPSSAAVVSSAHDRVSGSGTSSLDISRFGTLTEMSVDDTASKSQHELPADGRNALMDLKLPSPYNSAHEKTTSVHQAANATSSASTELCRNLAAPRLMDGHTACISDFPKDYASRETMETFSSSSRDLASSHERVCACAIWAGEWVPFNTELPMVEHAVAAWHTGSADARSELAKYQHALSIDCIPLSVEQQPSSAEQGLAAADQASMAQGLLQLTNKPSAASLGSLRPV